MTYLKVESGEATKTIPNIRKEYSNVSFVGGTPNQEFLDLHSLVEVTHVTRLKMLILIKMVINGIHKK